MKVAGIIAEYNPFHSGHAYHIKETKRITECDYLIVVMSGHFMQRGEAAVQDKFMRTRQALQAGADLVLELPTVFATGNAEQFAAGGVRTLDACGVCTHLSFGSEMADIEQLSLAAKLLTQETDEFKTALHHQLQEGKSFPRARYDALSSLGSSPALLQAFSAPNSILALEYLKQLELLNAEMVPIAVKRIGSYHNSSLSDTYPSASAIRAALRSKDNTDQLFDSSFFMAANCPFQDGQVFAYQNANLAALYALRRMSLDELHLLPEVSEGFENVIYRASRTQFTMETYLQAVKSKRYTLARCRRIAMYALLGITKDLWNESKNSNALYLRILGFKKTARPLLSAIDRCKKAPVVARHADTNNLSDAAKALAALDLLATDIYLQCSHSTCANRDFAHPPVIL